MSRFTLQPVEWTAWLPTVDPATATPAQNAALDKSPPQARVSPYFLTLAHDVAALDQRSPLFNAVMYARVGCAGRTGNWQPSSCRSSTAASIAPAYTPAASPN